MQGTEIHNSGNVGLSAPLYCGRLVAEVGATVGIANILAGLPTVTPQPQTVRGGGLPKEVTVDV